MLSREADQLTVAICRSRLGSGEIKAITGLPEIRWISEIPARRKPLAQKMIGQLVLNEHTVTSHALDGV